MKTYARPPLSGGYLSDSAKDFSSYLAPYQDAIAKLEPLLQSSIPPLVKHLTGAQGMLVFLGVGKSSYIARKASSSFNSIGIRSGFIHPTEAVHGELGILQTQDTLIVLSYSGSSRELLPVLTYAQHKNIPIVGITAYPATPLGKCAKHILHLPLVKEIDALGLCPTTSAVAMLIACDILMVQLMHKHNISHQSYLAFHPAGQRGHAAKTARDVMRKDSHLPRVAPDDIMQDVLLTITNKKAGCALITGAHNKLLGLITDGDLRRAMDKDFLRKKASAVMHKDPFTIHQDVTLHAAAALMQQKKINHLCVTDTSNNVLGLLHWQDCFLKPD